MAVAGRWTGRESRLLRLLHWNVHSWTDPGGGSNVETVVELVRDHRPHAVSLVEVDESWAEPSALTRIAEATGYTSVFAPAFEYGEGDPTGGFGNAVLTRLPISAVRHRQLTWPDSTYARSEPSEPRTLLLVTLAADGDRPVHVGSTHLPRRDAEARARALDRIKIITAGLAHPWVVLGDFNTPPESWVAADGPLRAAPRGDATAPSQRPTSAIDYGVSGPGTTITAEVLDTSGSDHRPVLVALEVQDGAG